MFGLSAAEVTLEMIIKISVVRWRRNLIGHGPCSVRSHLKRVADDIGLLKAVHAQGPPWTAAACCRFRAGSLLPSSRLSIVIIQNSSPQQAVERKAAAGLQQSTTSPKSDWMNNMPERFNFDGVFISWFSDELCRRMNLGWFQTRLLHRSLSL